MGFSVEMLNAIRNEASGAYQQYVPQATRDNIAQVGNAILQYTLVYNEFQNLLIHKIGKSMIEKAMFKNKLARFKTGTLSNQQDVEEIFVPMYEKVPMEYDPDPNATTLFQRSSGGFTTQVHYHRMNRQDMYDFEIGEQDFRRVFRSEEALDNYITAKFNSVYTRAEYDEYIHMKELLAGYANKLIPMGSDQVTANLYVDYAVTSITNEETARAFVRTVRKASMDMSFFSNKCNGYGNMLSTPVENQVLLINKDVIAHVDVDVLAKSFNMGKTDFQPDIVTLDDFGSMEDTYGLLIDKDFFRVWDTYSAMKKQENGAGLFTKYFYHIWQILSLSPYKNAVRLTTNPQDSLKDMVGA